MADERRSGFHTTATMGGQWLDSEIVEGPYGRQELRLTCGDMQVWISPYRTNQFAADIADLAAQIEATYKAREQTR